MMFISSEQRSKGPVEIRVPTFKRIQMLSACLDSLIAQTWTDWRAIVFDDAADSAAQHVVASKNDSRIVYRANESRLGAAANLNQCFQTLGYYPDSAFACCLEDDNWLYPDALASNIKTLNESGLAIMMRNQDMFSRSAHGVVPLGRTTLGSWFERSGVYDPIALVARTFFYTGISNGALFWRTSSLSNLQDPFGVIDPSLQEYIRCWQIQEPVFVRLDAAHAYSDPDSPTFRHYTKDKSFSRAIQVWHNRFLSRHGDILIGVALDCAASFGMVDSLSRSISNLATLQSLRILYKNKLQLYPLFAIRGLIKRLVVRSYSF